MLNIEELKKMEPSRGLDAVIADKVMGQIIIKDIPDFIPPGFVIHPKLWKQFLDKFDPLVQAGKVNPGDLLKHRVARFTTDADDAVLVLQRMDSLGFEFEMRKADGQHHVRFYPAGEPQGEWMSGTFPMAICKAALVAVDRWPIE